MTCTNCKQPIETGQEYDVVKYTSAAETYEHRFASDCIAPLRALAKQLLSALEAVENSGEIGGEGHPLDLCRCGNCAVRRLIAHAKGRL